MGKLCRFCGSAETSSAAAWPEWATRLIGMELTAGYALGSVETMRARIFKAFPDGMRDDFIAVRKLNVACKRCLHGWMGRIDAAVRPLLMPLITGRDVVLTLGAQRALAAWTAKTVMIAEFASAEGVVTPRTERAHLRATLEPPPNWNIWIARSAGRDWVARYVRHTAGLGQSGRGAKDTQSVTLGMGRILVHVMTSTVPGMKFELPERAESFHFLWPVRRAIAWPPRNTLDHEAVETFNLGFNRDFGAPEVDHIIAAE